MYGAVKIIREFTKLMVFYDENHLLLSYVSAMELRK